MVSINIHVALEGTGSCRSLGEALQTIPTDNREPVTIYLHEGIYKEKLVIDRPYITLIGDGADKSIITYDHYARMVMSDQSKRGTFRTQTLLVNTHDFMAKNITIENTSGIGRDVGQAIALYVDGDRNSFYHCKILGSQDTLFTGPLPPSAYQAGGFTGPLEFAPRINGRQYYYQCLIKGDVDFIFGSATAYFEECEIFSCKNDAEPPNTNPEDQKVYGYITAASTPEGQEYGYVFDRCRITGNCPPDSVYLGRPWRNFARTVFIECELGEHIRREGWHDWDKQQAHGTVLYGEYHSRGPGANPVGRAKFSKQFSEKDVEKFTKERILW
jgi:pectinesterase